MRYKASTIKDKTLTKHYKQINYEQDRLSKRVINENGNPTVSIAEVFECLSDYLVGEIEERYDCASGIWHVRTLGTDTTYGA